MSKKICILTDSLGAGGAEKMAANMSLSLVEKGYEVHVVSMLNKVHYSFGGTLYNFGSVKENNNKLNAFFKFKSYFKNNDFDVIIDHRVRSHFFKETIFSKWIFKKCSVIYCVHHFDLSLYFSSVTNPFLAKFPHVKNRLFVSVSSESQKHLKQNLDIESNLIYNYVLEKDIENNVEAQSKKLDFNYIIAVGRLVKMKQFDVLIDSYKNSLLTKNNIKLLILGEGEEEEYLRKQIEDLNLEAYVKLEGFKNNAFEYIKNAKSLVLSSQFEGFPMVLIEALALKTPLIALDCKSGPNEIINHEVNGLLLPAQNSELLTKAMDRLLLDAHFYNEIKSNINKQSNPFSEKNAVNQWVNLIESFS